MSDRIPRVPMQYKGFIEPSSDDVIHIELPPFYINQSRWKSYQDCDRLYGWTYLERLEPRRKRHYFEFGTAIHAAQVAVQAQSATSGAIVNGVQVAEESFRNGMTQPIQLPGDEQELQEGLQLIRQVLPAYYAYYGSSQLWKPLGMELKFCVEVGEGTNVFLVGRIDNLVNFQGSLWIVDTKTMSKLDMRTFLQYELDVQLTAYIYGATKQLSLDAMKAGNPPVIIRGAIIDGIVKTKVPQFHRELYTRTIDDLREFEQEFVEKAREIAAKHARVKNGEPWKVVFPKNTQHCHRYGTCAFKDLCLKDNDVRRLSYTKRELDYVDAERNKI